MKPRGFAAIDPERQREIASIGGKAAHVNGAAHEFTPEEATVAGARGAAAIKEKYGRQYTHHMAEIGRKGGQARARKAAERAAAGDAEKA